MKTLVSTLLLIIVFVSSCSRENLPFAKEKITVNYTIPVYEQENVSHYDVEVLYNGKYVIIDTFFANDEKEFVYVIDVDVTGYWKLGEVLNVRFKAVDNDGKVTYSQIVRNQ